LKLELVLGLVESFLSGLIELSVENFCKTSFFLLC
jgi:hypothetical protein